MLGGEGGPGRSGRSYGPSRDQSGEAKAVIPTRPKPKKRPGAALRAEPPKERSKNGGVSLVRRSGAAVVELWTTSSTLAAMRCGYTRAGWARGRCRGELQWESFNERRHRVHPRQLHADVFRAGTARFRHRALAGAPAAHLRARRRSAVLVFRAVLDRIFVPLQFRLVSGNWRRASSDGRTVPSSWRSASPASALPWWDCWRSGGASICGSRPSSGPPAFSGARPAVTSIR